MLFAVNSDLRKLFLECIIIFRALPSRLYDKVFFFTETEKEYSEKNLVRILEIIR